MIEFTKAWKIGDAVYPTLRAAQLAGLTELFKGSGEPDRMAAHVLDNQAQVIAILTGTKPRRKRSDAGKAHAKPAKPPKIPARVMDMPIGPGKFPENAGVTIEPSSKYKGK